MSANTYRFYHCCVDWPEGDVHCAGGLCDMISANREISRRTFLRHVDRADLRGLEADLSYETHPAKGLTMAADWHVSYHRSVLHGRRVYYFRNSGIEHVFVRGSN